MASLIANIFSHLHSLVRGLVLPLLRAVGGIVLTLTIPILRAGAGICLIIGAVALASDIGPVGSASQRPLKATTVIEHWQKITPASLEATRLFLTKRTRVWVWDAFSAPLRLPAVVFFSLIGVWLGYLGRRRHRVNIFAN